MKKFKNKYRIQSHRKPNWDYSADALYFLTIVTQNREHNLGKIIEKEMILSNFGKIVETEWHKSFEIRKELILHAFVIMPNHLHAIVEIKNDLIQTNDMGMGENGMNDTGTDDTTLNAETHGRIDTPDRAETHGRGSLLAVGICYFFLK